MQKMLMGLSGKIIERGDGRRFGGEQHVQSVVFVRRYSTVVQLRKLQCIDLSGGTELVRDIDGLHTIQTVVVHGGVAHSRQQINEQAEPTSSAPANHSLPLDLNNNRWTGLSRLWSSSLTSIFA